MKLKKGAHPPRLRTRKLLILKTPKGLTNYETAFFMDVLAFEICMYVPISRKVIDWSFQSFVYRFHKISNIVIYDFSADNTMINKKNIFLTQKSTAIDISFMI